MALSQNTTAVFVAPSLEFFKEKWDSLSKEDKLHWLTNAKSTRRNKKGMVRIFMDERDGNLTTKAMMGATILGAEYNPGKPGIATEEDLNRAQEAIDSRITELFIQLAREDYTKGNLSDLLIKGYITLKDVKAIADSRKTSVKNIISIPISARNASRGTLNEISWIVIKELGLTFGSMAFESTKYRARWDDDGNILGYPLRKLIIDCNKRELIDTWPAPDAAEDQMYWATKISDRLSEKGPSYIDIEPTFAYVLYLIKNGVMDAAKTILRALIETGHLTHETTLNNFLYLLQLCELTGLDYKANFCDTKLFFNKNGLMDQYLGKKGNFYLLNGLRPISIGINLGRTNISYGHVGLENLRLNDVEMLLNGAHGSVFTVNQKFYDWLVAQSEFGDPEGRHIKSRLHQFKVGAMDPDAPVLEFV